MVDVNACIEEVVAATAAQSGAAVTTRLGQVPELFASRTEIRLLLAQLVDNAVRAVEQVEGAGAASRSTPCPATGGCSSPSSTTARGSRRERRRQIFRPFYTTRDGALGLGLTVVGELVRKYEGGIKVSSLPGQGTVARITLPPPHSAREREAGPCRRARTDGSHADGSQAHEHTRTPREHSNTRIVQQIEAAGSGTDHRRPARSVIDTRAAPSARPNGATPERNTRAQHSMDSRRGCGSSVERRHEPHRIEVMTAERRGINCKADIPVHPEGGNVR